MYLNGEKFGSQADLHHVQNVWKWSPHPYEVCTKGWGALCWRLWLWDGETSKKQSATHVVNNEKLLKSPSLPKSGRTETTTVYGHASSSVRLSDDALRSTLVENSSAKLQKVQYMTQFFWFTQTGGVKSTWTILIAGEVEILLPLSTLCLSKLSDLNYGNYI